MQKGFITPLVLGILTALAIGGSLVAYSRRDVAQEGMVGGNPFIYTSAQVGSSPANGDVLQTDGTNSTWVATSTLGIAAGSGTVTSVDFSVPTGLTISGNPITTSGTLALAYDTGYAAVLTASTSNWNTFYDTPSTRITAGTGLSWAGNTLNGHAAVTLAGEDYLSLSTQEITANAINADNLSASDFGDFACDGTDCEVDASFLAKNLAWTGTGTTTYAGNIDVDGDIEADVFYANVKIINQGDITASYYTATSTTATSTLPLLSTTAISIAGEYISNFTTYVRSLFTVGTGLTVAAGQFAIDLAANLTWTGAHDFGGATSLEIPNGTAPTVNAIGKLALDTTDNQLLVATSTNASYPGVIRTVEDIYKFAIASTSPVFASGASKRLPKTNDGYTVKNILCDVEGGTSKAITIYGETITCDLDGATDDGSISSATLAANASTTITMGATSGAVNWLNVTIKGVWTRE